MLQLLATAFGKQEKAIVNLGMTKMCLIGLIMHKRAVFVLCEVGRHLEKSECWIKENIGVLGV